MAKARAIVKRRKAVRNIRKITKTMQMIATAKFQKALKRAVGTKPYSKKVRELVAELAGSLDDVSHPLLRAPGNQAGAKIALVVITSNRGLAGAYNGRRKKRGSRSICWWRGKRDTAISISRSGRWRRDWT
jgi:F-type H+-transporting ATPase subunit gamma